LSVPHFFPQDFAHQFLNDIKQAFSPKNRSRRFYDVQVYGALFAVLWLAFIASGCGSSSPGAPAQTTPAITWASPSPISYGTALSATQLNATASTDGSFTYAPALGAVLSAGTQALQATFTPSDTTHFTIITATVSLTINQARPVITWTPTTTLALGTVLSATQLNATANVPGKFIYAPGAGTVLSTAGKYSVTATFTPADSLDFAGVTATITFSVGQAIPVITWTPPGSEPRGTVLDAAELDASANVAGSFTYSPGAGTILSSVGSTQIVATFTPTDTISYATATATRTIHVTASAPSNYSWSNVQIVGGGYVTGAYFHPTDKGLMYARTDIGGAYRKGPADATWVPLLDGLSPATWWYGGVEAIGLDPTDANRLYLAVGEYALEPYGGNGAMLVSEDQGATFTTVPFSFRNGANDTGRNAGERIAVDANSPNIVYFGTRLAGLQISIDRGISWQESTGLPVTSTANGSGIVAVVPVASSGSSGAATPVVYAAVAGTGVGGDPVGLYVSTAAGTAKSAWTAVQGQPLFAGTAMPLAPLHAVLGASGKLYVLYADQPGPTNITSSQLWEFTPGASWSSGTWRQITLPVSANGIATQRGFGGLTIDPSHSGVLLVATIDQYAAGDTIYRSTDDGATWKDVSAAGGTHSASGAPYLTGLQNPVGTGNWATSLAIDPFNSDHAMYGTGSMLWDSTNLTAADTGQIVNWLVGAKGIEETSINFMLAPPSGATLLLSAMKDINGFAHQQLTASPAQGFYAQPAATPSSMDFEQSSPTTVVRVTSGVAPFGVISKDAGLSWTSFVAMPTGTSIGGGSIAIAPDGSSLVWATADTSSVWYSRNLGASWSPATGVPALAAVVSDRLIGGLYYAYSGKSLYVSTNGGANWSEVQNTLPGGGTLIALPDSSGHLLLAVGTSGLWEASGSAAMPILQKLSSVATANIAAYGKSAGGSAPLTWYLYGAVDAGDVSELFTSIDSGTTWTQINDASHQWGGGVNSLSGDMRTFGTVYVGTNGRGIILGTSQ
jgi:hypothetical protein